MLYLLGWSYTQFVPRGCSHCFPTAKICGVHWSICLRQSPYVALADGADLQLTVILLPLPPVRLNTLQVIMELVCLPLASSSSVLESWPQEENGTAYLIYCHISTAENSNHDISDANRPVSQAS